jgi:large conductance mechanosensitive channel
MALFGKELRMQIDPAKKAFSLLDEFKAFALKGNVIDLAVGVIIGAAFGDIIKSLVDDITMPLVSTILPGGGYQNWSAEVNGAQIHFGKFLGAVVKFLIIALCLFIFIVKFVGFIMRTKKEAPLPPITKDQELLTEIRDLLKRSTPPLTSPTPGPP